MEAGVEDMDIEKPGENLVLLIKQFIKEEKYDSVKLLFSTKPAAERNLLFIDNVSTELYQDVCLKSLTTENHENNYDLYSCAEYLLKVLVKNASVDELILELLDVIETQTCEHVFTTALHALQIALLRLDESKARVFEWSFNSVITYVQKLPLPTYLTEGYDDKQKCLLEQDEQIERLLMTHITISLFYEPLLDKALVEVLKNPIDFYDFGINRRNMVCCFLLKLFDKPFALLNISDLENKTNTYTVQIAMGLTKAITKCIGDPYYFLTCFNKRTQNKKYENATNNVFLMPDKVAIETLGIYYYMLFMEDIDVDKVPKVYAPLYVYESTVYFVLALLHKNEPPLQYRGMLLLYCTLKILYTVKIPGTFLELSETKNLIERLTQLSIQSPRENVRTLALETFATLIKQFENRARICLLKTLMETTKQNALLGYLMTLYKGTLSEIYISGLVLPVEYTGEEFRYILLQIICDLPRGEETDLAENFHSICAALNVLLYCAKSERTCTAFGTIYEKIDKKFYIPLTNALNLSIAHYKAQYTRCEQGLDTDDNERLQNLELLNVQIANGNDLVPNFNFTKERKLALYQEVLNKFNLLTFLLSENTEYCRKSFHRSRNENEQEQAQAVDQAQERKQEQEEDNSDEHEQEQLEEKKQVPVLVQKQEQELKSEPESESLLMQEQAIDQLQENKKEQLQEQQKVLKHEHEQEELQEQIEAKQKKLEEKQHPQLQAQNVE